jgi:hypothetical protein
MEVVAQFGQRVLGGLALEVPSAPGG